jgi:hypothetical protein
MKWLLLGVGLLVALGVAIYLLVMALTGDAAKAANKFLDLVGKGKVEQAYKEAAPLFRQQQTLEGFRRAVLRYRIDKYKSASWPTREIKNNRTVLTGVIEMRDGGKLPASVGLMKIGETWRVYGMTFNPDGPASAPKREEIEKLVRRSLLDFNQAVQRKDFSAFHATLSSAMRKKYTPAQIQGVFRIFIAQDIDISGIKSARPRFGPAPRLNDKGELAVNGRYPTRPSEVLFSLRYAREGGQWRLIGINVRVKPVK